MSALPSALFVLFIYALVSSGAWSGDPDPHKLAEAVGDISLGHASVLLLFTLSFGVLLHPLQFSLTQLLEGYWGTGFVQRYLALVRIRHHRRCAASLDRAFTRAMWNAERVGRDALHGEEGDRWLATIVDEQAYQKALQTYPERLDRILPTRLGNVIRRYEDDAGGQYGLDALLVAPHLTLVSASTDLAYLQDAREQLDLAVRLCVLSLLAAGTAVAFLVTDGPWLLMALVPYGLSYVFYRGAIVAAHNFGVTLGAVIDLNRFEFYRRLHMRLPTDTAEERRANDVMQSLLRFQTTPVVGYEHPSTDEPTLAETTAAPDPSDESAE